MGRVIKVKVDLEGDKAPGVPRKSDWENAKKMADFLEHFYELTLRVSATHHVTSDTYFHEIADVLVLLREWCQSEDKTCREMGKKMLEKYYKYWGEKYGDKQVENGKEKQEQMLNIVIFFCVAVDPRYKLSEYTKIATMVMFGHEVGEKLWEKVNASFRSMFEEYRKLYAKSDKASQATDSQEPATNKNRLMRSIIAQQLLFDNAGSASTRSELDKYLAEETESEKKGFDILAWWKDNANRFPILARMARDLLAIPISTVASESAFSCSGRVLDDFRSSLTPTMVERLICAQDWLRGSTSTCLSVEEDPEALDKIEEALIAEMSGLAVSPKVQGKVSHPSTWL